jgi:hypothetical protein
MLFVKKIKTIFTLLFLAFVLSSSLQAQVYVNFAEALQKSIYFYDANKCNLTAANRLPWRGPCHMKDTQMPLDNVSTNMSAAGI